MKKFFRLSVIVLAVTSASALLSAGTPEYLRANLQFSTKTRNPKLAGVPPLIAPAPGAPITYYKTLQFSGGSENATSPLESAGAGGRPRQSRSDLSGSINYFYDASTDSIQWTNGTLLKSGDLFDVPAWASNDTNWPQPPVLTVTVPVNGGSPIEYGASFISVNNPLAMTVINATRAADDGIFHGGIFGGNQTSAVEWRDYREMTLSDADTQGAAESRARVDVVPSATDRNLAYTIRGTPAQGASWTIREVKVTARTNLGCSGLFEKRVIYQRRLIGQNSWEILPTETTAIDVKNPELVDEFDLTMIDNYEIGLVDLTYRKLSDCASCGGGGPPGGPSDPKPGSIDWQIPLGLGPDGHGVGYLLVYSQHIAPSLYTSASLQPAIVDSAATVLRDSQGNVRQVLAPQALADVVTTGAQSYEIRFYNRSSVGSLDSATGLFVTTGNAYQTWRVENPDSSGAVRWKVTRNVGSQQIVTLVDESLSGTTVFSEANGLRVTTTTESIENGDRVETVVVKDSSGVVASKQKTYYHTFAWGDERVKEVLDPDGAALTTEWTYQTDSDFGAYRKITSIKHPDGFTESMVYNGEASGQVIATYAPIWKQSTKATGIQTTVTDLDGDGVTDFLTKTSDGQFLTELSLSYEIDWGAKLTISGNKYRLHESRRATTPSVAWNDAGNIVTRDRLFAEGPHAGELAYRLNPDGTLLLRRFQANADGGVTITEEQGVSDSVHEAVVDGERTVRVLSARGLPVSTTVVDIATGNTLSSETVGASDEFGRPTRIVHTDGAEEIRGYCLTCGAMDHVSLRGETVDYEFDALHRKVLETRTAGTAILAKSRFEYDASGRLTKTYRVNPVDNTEMLIASSTYDLAGRITATTSLQSGATSYSYAFGENNSTITTTTYADGGTRVETHGASGALIKVTGTAVAPIEYDWSARSSDGRGTGYLALVRRFYDATNFVTETNGVNYLGEVADTTFADGSHTNKYFDAIGRLVRQVDQDGVTVLFGYDARGRQAVTAVDMDGNNTIDFAGTDRVTWTLFSVAVHDGSTVQRTTTQAWETDGQDSPTTVSISDSGVDGLHSWQTLRGLTTSSVTAYDELGGRTVTTTTPDGVQSIQAFTGDRLVSSAVKDSSGAQLTATTNAYDDLGRLHTSTDARNGTTTYTYDTNDRLHSVTTPDPDTTRSGNGYDPQTTVYDYDAMGRTSSVTQPDGGVVNTTYYPNSQIKRTWGSRTYPVEYTYDVQLRVKTMTTWQDFAGDTGKAVTTWNYDDSRGWLNNKRYADNTGPSYLYKPSGRLQRRTWARGVQANYTYNAAGELNGVDYSDTTPDVTMGYDRSGRPNSITDGAGTRSLSYDSSGQLKDEDYSAGLLGALSVHRAFDSLSRLSSVSALSAISVLSQTGFSYDAGSRLDTVTAGANTATYSYVANSPLVGGIVFRQGGVTRLTTAKSYDDLNRLVSVTNTPSAASALSAAYTYNSANQRTKTVRENSAYWSYGYDTLGQVTSAAKFQADNTGVLGHDFAWTYDDIGNRKTATANGQTSSYTPNALNQYAQRSVPGTVDVLGAAAAGSTVTITVASGTPQATTRQGELFFKQLTVANATATQNPSFKITGVKNLVGPNGEDAVTEITKTAFVAATPEVFTHDADGNLTDDARWHYAWDGENRLITMQTQAAVATAFPALNQKLEFAYDGQSRRTAKKVYHWNTTSASWVLDSSLLFLHDGWNLLADLNALNNNSVVCTYTWGLDLSGSFQDAGGVGGLLFAGVSTAPGSSLTTHAATFDGNGNVIAYVDMATGARSATYEYGAFGETSMADGVAVELFPFKFSTRYTDNETGLIDYSQRFYDPNRGRFLSRDPIEEDGGTNLYGFVASDPISNVDVLGLAGYFFDGTGNNRKSGTNVLILHDVYGGLRYYYRGVGSSFGTRAVGGLTGAGGHNRLEAAYRDFIRAVDSGDRYVDIVGFSRGAALSREFANLLVERGYDPAYGGQLKHKLKAGRNTPPGECEFVIRFVGLFDTVGSFGVPGNNINIGIRMGLPGEVLRAAQATAKNERRLLFPLTPLGEREGFDEQGFAGDHSDIGRGHGKGTNDLSRAPLEYIWNQGRVAGAPFGPLPQYTPTGNTTPHDLSRNFPHNLFPKRPR